MHPAQTSDGTVPHGALEAAVARAITESLGAITDYQRRVDDALTALEGVAVRARAGVGADTSANEVVDAFWNELQARRTEAADLFDRQRKVLATVNIALFGRTGAGKNSLNEALVHGDAATSWIPSGQSRAPVAAQSWGELERPHRAALWRTGDRFVRWGSCSGY